MIVVITSIQNARIKQWKKLQQRKHRQREKKFLIEGVHLIEEALNSNWSIEVIIAQETTELPSELVNLEIVYVTENVFNHLAQTKTPQGLIAVVEMQTLPFENNGHVLLLDAIQDPGNLGTIIRTADAAGFSAMFLGQGTVDPYNDKVLRATQGSLFHLPIIQGELGQIIAELKEHSYTILATDLSDQTVDYYSVQYIKKGALILGNEGAGIQQKYIDVADKSIKIPIYGQAESLNVSVAAGILMYHLRQQ